jgi:hypothetical protein
MRWYRLGLIGALLVMTAAAVATFAERPAQPENSDQMVFLPIIARPQIPVIKLFQVQPAAADPGQTVTLSWEVEHADEVTLIRFWDFRPAQWWTDLPLVGSQEYTVPDWERNPVYFTLDAYDVLRPLLWRIYGSPSAAGGLSHPLAERLKPGDRHQHHHRQNIRQHIGNKLDGIVVPVACKRN